MKLAASFFLFFLLIAGAPLFFPIPASAQTVSDYDKQIKPVLQIPIPNLPAFSNITITGSEGDEVRRINVPFLAEYISAVYKYAVVIAGLLATTMVTTGGLQYLVARGDAGRVTKAKERITNAVIGLVLTLGAYLILVTVNPSLTDQNAFNLQIIQRNKDFNEVLAETTEQTADASSPAAGSHTPSITSCPFTLSDPKNKLEFIQQVLASPTLRSGSPSARATNIADAALACRAYLGSCGNTAATVQALAGIGPSKCITIETNTGRLPPKGCNVNQGRQRNGLSPSQRAQLYGLRCGSDKGYGARYIRADCLNSQDEALKKIRDYLRAEAAAGNLPGWPDGWANALQPGDHVVFYTGNKDLVGAHAVIFVGWGAGGRMQVVQGSSGRATFSGSPCVKSECGDKMMPLLNIYAAQ